MTVILVAHILVSLVLVIVVLMQRSEGGGLGIGGGGGGAGGIMSGRGVAGGLVRATIIFGAIFFVTSLGLNRLTTQSAGQSGSALEQNINEGAVDQQEQVGDELGISVDDVFPADDTPPSDNPQ